VPACRAVPSGALLPDGPACLRVEVGVDHLVRLAVRVFVGPQRCLPKGATTVTALVLLTEVAGTRTRLELLLHVGPVTPAVLRTAFVRQVGLVGFWKRAVTAHHRT